MSKVAIKGADTGTGVFTLESPATNTDRTLVLPDEAGTVLTTAGVPTSAMPAGCIIKITPSYSSTGQDVLVSNTWVEISPSLVSVVATRANSKFIYNMTLSYESDVAANFNIFFQLKRRINGGSYTELANSVVVSTAIRDEQGTGGRTINYMDNSISGVAQGDTIDYVLQFSKSNASSIYFNQQSLGGQPAGTSNYCVGYVMEVSQ